MLIILNCINQVELAMKQHTATSLTPHEQREVRTLDQLVNRQKVRVVHVKSESPEVQARLLTLGLYPGVRVEVLRRAPLGDPLQVRSGSTLLSIRLHEARGIEVGLNS